MGYWTRANAEICLLATGGKPTAIYKSPSDRGRKNNETFQKPAEVRDTWLNFVVMPHIELYAANCDGWSSWGNQLKGRHDVQEQI